MVETKRFKTLKRFGLEKLALVLIIISISYLSSCTHTTYLSNGYGTSYAVSVNSFGTFNMKGKTYYIESGSESVSSSDLEFIEFAKYLEENLKIHGAILTFDKKNADVVVLMNYSIADASYVETVPIPIWGKTGISSISTTSNTRSSAYGNAYSYGGYTSGSVYGNSRTNSNTQINYSYGITGYQNVNRNVTQFSRVVNIYAYDNKKTSSSPIMLWKTQLFSSGTSSNLRKVMPYIMYAGCPFYGKSTDGWRDYGIFENDYMFHLWKLGYFTKSNITIYPGVLNTNTSFKIAFIEKLQDKTIVCIEKTGCPNWYSISPFTYIYYNGKRVKVSYVDNYELGVKIKKECGTRYLKLHFPCKLNNVYNIDVVEYTDEKENELGWVWKGISIK